MALITLRDVDISQDGELLFNTITKHSIIQPILEKNNLFQETYEEFKVVLVKRLNYYIKLFKIICYNDEFCGFIMSYDYKFNDRHIKIIACLSEDNWGEIGEPLYTSYLNLIFSYYNLRKVYVELSSINQEEILFLKKIGFIEELNLQNYYLHNGKRINKLYFSMGYDTFYEKYQSKVESIL